VHHITRSLGRHIAELEWLGFGQNVDAHLFLAETVPVPGSDIFLVLAAGDADRQNPGDNLARQRLSP